MANSRPWKVTAQAPIKKVVLAEDHVQTRVDVPPILPPEETAEILAGELKSRHFKDSGGDSLVRERGGVRVQVQPRTGEVTISVEASEEVELPPDNPSPCTCRMREVLREGLSQSQKNSLGKAQDKLQQAVTSRLEGSLARLGCELESIAQRVTVEAVKRKAAQLGQVKTMTEDRKTGSLTIVLEV
jgi:hypothetical protein